MYMLHCRGGRGGSGTLLHTRAATPASFLEVCLKLLNTLFFKYLQLKLCSIKSKTTMTHEKFAKKQPISRDSSQSLLFL